MEAGSTRKKRERPDKPYKGIRMRKWGKWVAEIREPNKRSRIWLGSYCTPVAAARAYDTAVYYLRGQSSRLNFPELLVGEGPLGDLSSASIRRKAIEVGSRVDAMETSFHRVNPTVLGGGGGGGVVAAEVSVNRSCCNWFNDKPDLNLKPEPEDSDCEDV